MTRIFRIKKNKTKNYLDDTYIIISYIVFN